MRSRTAFLLLGTLWFATPVVFAGEDEPVIVNVKRLSLDSALVLARGAIAECRKRGIQVGVTVVDRSGQPTVVLRDVLAPELTLRASEAKAYTAVSFNSATSKLGDRFTHPHSVAKLDKLIMTAGGLPIAVGGNLLGAVGVSGAPSGETDEACAQAGLDTVMEDLEMGGS